jgi:ribosomal protein S18 acetylase RimI-like enzyme
MSLTIRKAESQDENEIWNILKEVISKGDSFAFDPNSPKEKMMAYWMEPEKRTYVAVLDDTLVGSFFIKANQPGLGSHIANAGYMTSPLAVGKGIGKAMGQFSLEEAKRLGYKAMQFNIVVKSNERAVRLWQSLGFNIIGEIPEAFNHQTLGMTNAYIMYQKLS